MLTRHPATVEELISKDHVIIDTDNYDEYQISILLQSRERFKTNMVACKIAPRSLFVRYVRIVCLASSRDHDDAMLFGGFSPVGLLAL